MNVFVKVLLKLLQAVIVGVIRGASADWSGKSIAQAPKLRKHCACRVMFPRHHGDGIRYVAKTGLRLRAA
jgi:hypothetical protein